MRIYHGLCLRAALWFITRARPRFASAASNSTFISSSTLFSVSFASCLLFFMFFMFMRKTLPSFCLQGIFSFYVFRWDMPAIGARQRARVWKHCQQSSWRYCIVCLLASAAVALFAFWFMLSSFLIFCCFLCSFYVVHPLAILKDLHS